MQIRDTTRHAICTDVTEFVDEGDLRESGEQLQAMLDASLGVCGRANKGSPVVTKDVRNHKPAQNMRNSEPKQVSSVVST